MDKKYRTLTFNMSLFFISTFAGKFLVFLMMPLYTGKLSPEQYSDADLIVYTSSLLLPFITLGIVNGLLRFGLDRRYDKKEVISSCALFYLNGIALASIFIPLLSPLHSFFRVYGWLLILYILTNCMHTLMQQSVRIYEKTVLYASEGLLNTVLTLALTCLFLIKYNMKTEGYILAIILADFIGALVLFVCGRLWSNFNLRAVNKELIKELLRYSLPLIPASLCWWIIGVADRYFVIYFTSAAIGGIYIVSHKIPSIINLLSTIFSEAWQISAIKEGTRNDAEDFFSNVFRTYSSMVFIASAGLTLLCKPLFIFMTDSAYHSGWTLIPLLVAGAAYSCLSSFMSSIYTVSKRTKASLNTSIIGAVANLLLCLVLVPFIGAMGAAIAVFLTHFILFIVRILGASEMMDIALPYSKIFVSTCLLLLLSVLVIKELWSYALIYVFVIIAINLPDIWKAGKMQLKDLYYRFIK